MKILVVDDNAQYREAFSRAILLEGYEVCEAADTDEALAQILEEHPDVVVTDLQMRTEREGLELIEILKAYDPLLPVIMISGVGSFEEGALATKMGAAHVIHKSRIEDEMEGFFETVRSAHAAAGRSREQLAVVAAARERAGEDAEAVGALEAVRALVSNPDVDPYVKGEAYDLIVAQGDAELRRESESTIAQASASERYEELHSAAEARLHAALPGYDAMDGEAKRALTTAEYLYSVHGESGTPDFSRSIAFSYSLAVECEARARLKGKITRLASDPLNRRLLEACMDLKSRRVDMYFQQSLMQATRQSDIHFTIANVKHILSGLLARKGNFKVDGLKDVGIMLLCFGRNYSFIRWGQRIEVNNPLRLKGLQGEDEVLGLAGLLISLQYARNPYVHPDTGKRERLTTLRGIALASLNELGKLR